MHRRAKNLHLDWQFFKIMVPYLLKTVNMVHFNMDCFMEYNIKSEPERMGSPLN